MDAVNGGDLAEEDAVGGLPSNDPDADGGDHGGKKPPRSAWSILGLCRAPAGADLSTGRVTAYGVGSFAMSVVGDLVSFYINPFLLENVGLAPTSVGNLLLIAKVFDAFIDPIIGAASDETRSPLGRRRPWFLVGLPGAALFNILLWTVWDGLQENSSAQFAYYLGCYCTLILFFTCFYIPYTALPVTVSAKDIDRVRLSTARTALMLVGDMVAVGVLTICGALIADSSRGYQVAASVNAVIIVAAILTTFLGVPEPSSLKLPSKGMRTELRNFFHGLWFLLHSWTYMCLALTASLGWLSIYFVQNNLYLYAKYAIGLPELFDAILLLALASCAILVPVWATLLSYLSKRKVMAIGIGWLILTWLLVMLAPPNSVPLACVGAVLSGGGISVASLMPWVMLSDVIDEDELEHGHRREGLLSAFFVFLNKVSVGMSLAISGYVLAAGGYDNADGIEPEPTDELNRTMRLLCGLLPAACAVLMIPLLYFNPMTHSKQLEINRRVVAQRSKMRRSRVAVVDEGTALLLPSSSPPSAAEPLPSASDVSFGRGNLY